VHEATEVKDIEGGASYPKMKGVSNSQPIAIAVAPRISGAESHKRLLSKGQLARFKTAISMLIFCLNNPNSDIVGFYGAFYQFAKAFLQPNEAVEKLR